jgi:hypothetical protein
MAFKKGISGNPGLWLSAALQTENIVKRGVKRFNAFRCENIR